MALEDLVARARSGDGDALEAVLHEIEDLVYALAFRMLGTRHDAEDATQEILLKVARSIDGFRGEARFTTWVCRVASNHLLTARKRGAELKGATLETMAAWIDAGLEAKDPRVHDPILIEEAKLVCIQATLSCLDRDHRLAFILGEIVEVTSDEGAEALGISPEAFRQRLRRARRDIDEFLKGRCGLISADHRCTCDRQVKRGIATGLLDPAQLHFTSHPVHEQVGEIGKLIDAASLIRATPRWRAPRDFGRRVRRLLADLA